VLLVIGAAGVEAAIHSPGTLQRPLITTAKCQNYYKLNNLNDDGFIIDTTENNFFAHSPSHG
jgi:hypothetical protein